MLTLFHAPASPSSRVVWLLEELHADYKLEIVNFPKDDGSKADPRNPHPHGYAPALVHDDASNRDRRHHALSDRPLPAQLDRHPDEGRLISSPAGPMSRRPGLTQR